MALRGDPKVKEAALVAEARAARDYATRQRVRAELAEAEVARLRIEAEAFAEVVQALWPFWSKQTSMTAGEAVKLLLANQKDPGA